MSLIEVRGLAKYYRMGDQLVRALDGVDLTIRRGEFVAITGASGSGKSTMMHLLGCLDRPTGGKYILNGRDVSDLSDRELAIVRNREIGFVFQTFNLINRTSAVENVAVPLFYARLSATRGAALRALERVGLAHRASHNPNELSGGERQRVAIARAIVNDPPLLLADEPTGNLDTRTGEQIMEIFHSLNTQGVTIVIVTHEVDIARHSRRMVQMRDGQILADRPTDEVDFSTSLTGIRARHPTGTSASATAALTEPAATLVTHPDAGAESQPVLTPRLMRGVNAAFGIGIASIVAWTVALGCFGYLATRYGTQLQDPQLAKSLPPSVIALAFSGSASMLAAMVLGVLAIVFAIGARRRMRSEPGVWLGRRRAIAALVLGVISVGFPVISLAVNLIRRAF